MVSLKGDFSHRKAGWTRAPLTARENGPVIVRPEPATDYEEIRALVTVTMRPNDAELEAISSFYPVACPLRPGHGPRSSST
jgi:hypothetical protein